MQIFRDLIIAALILYLVTPEVEGGWFKRTFRKIGRGIRKGIKKVGRGIKDGVKKVGKAIKKVGCKVLFGVACPAGVSALGGMIGAGTSGLGSALVAAGSAALINRCQVRKNKCKRSADDIMQNMVIYPFSDEFSDYDFNMDKQIDYEEFVFSVMSKFPLGDPEELREPFIWADANGDGRLDMDEFQGAPFMFAHYGSDYASAA